MLIITSLFIFDDEDFKHARIYRKIDIDTWHIDINIKYDSVHSFPFDSFKAACVFWGELSQKLQQKWWQRLCFLK